MQSHYLRIITLVQALGLTISFFINGEATRNTLMVTLSIFASAYYITKAIENHGNS